ncbi:hypothetical protein PFLUV_G00141630 [Perca fluviatilis]|uniref:Uncharacterized protein n=1 Tax=Perca fluviatilis TaxID=8168 RepID=A0A6A5ESU2_PERFL|nr:hypothetical protein PFLUV_G00141630 [Perca fluviatilis]
MGETRALVYWHFFKPITIVLGGAKRQSPSTESLFTPIKPHCTKFGCSAIRVPLGVIVMAAAK